MVFIYCILILARRQLGTRHAFFWGVRVSCASFTAKVLARCSHPNVSLPIFTTEDRFSFRGTAVKLQSPFVQVSSHTLATVVTVTSAVMYSSARITLHT